MGALEPGGPTAGRARTVESNDKASQLKIKCMKCINTDDIACRPKAPTLNSYWPTETRNDVLYWPSARMLNYM